MRIELQGPSECALATLAALTDTPLSDVRAVALFHANAFTPDDTTYLTWEAFHAHPNGMFWRVLGRAVEHFGGAEMRRLWTDNMIAYGTDAYVLPTPTHSIPAMGRGTITIHRNDRQVGHIMPWENGRVYDTAHVKDGGWDLPDLMLQKYSGWFIFEIVIF